MTKVFLSRENGTISSRVDVEALLKAVRGMAVLHDFSREENVAAVAQESAGSGAVVLVGPEPGFYELDGGSHIMEAITGGGVNRNKIVTVDLTTATDPDDTGANTEVALLQINRALENVASREPLEHVDVKPEKRVVILGSDPAGTLLAKQMLEAGMGVTLVSRGEAAPRQGAWKAEYDGIAGTENFTAHPFSTLKSFSGIPGKYSLEFETGQQAHTVTCGAIAVATALDPPANEEIHALFHIPVGRNKELIPLANGKYQFRTRYPQVVLLPPLEDREPIEERIEHVHSYLMRFLSAGSYRHFFDTATVREDVCGACGTCVKTCMFTASGMDFEKKVSTVDQQRCVGCGNCVTACPTGARELRSSPTAEIFRNISAQRAPEGARGVVFACEGGGHPTLEDMARAGMPLSRSFSFMRIRCGARLDTQFISEAMNSGYAGVAVVCCKESRCVNDVGSLDLSRRFNLYRSVMRAKGIDANLLRIITIEKGDTEACAKALRSFAQYLEGGTSE